MTTRIVKPENPKRRNPQPATADVSAAEREYERLHWGETGSKRPVKAEVFDPIAEPIAVVLGELVAVIYRTTKGGDPPETDYVHHFAARKRPLLVFGRKSKKIAIAGGIYTVTERGIER